LAIYKDPLPQATFFNESGFLISPDGARVVLIDSQVDEVQIEGSEPMLQQ
jgi:hypothetical protein